MATDTGTKSTPAGAALHDCLRRHVARGERLYGVVDAARDRHLAFAAPQQFGQTIEWLFEDGNAMHMQGVAPYLVPIAFSPSYPYEGSGYLDLWAGKLGKSSGILLVSSADPKSLREHLGGVFRVTDERDYKFYFRFYDPRVLRVYLPTCTAEEAQQFFGPIRHILVEAEDKRRLKAYRAVGSGVREMEEVLGPPRGSRTGGRSTR
ncbi:MAG: DUF4123 domain-containing protein [bacterium]|nr:DUF4123 domain-containing protein [bacterium]